MSSEIILAIMATMGVPVFTWLTKRSMDRRAADEEVLASRLREQRADFESLIAPLSEEVARLRESVKVLESRLDQEEADSKMLLATLFHAIEAMRKAIPPVDVYLPARVQELLSANYPFKSEQ